MLCQGSCKDVAPDAVLSVRTIPDVNAERRTKVVIGLAGKARSGKSTLAAGLAGRLGGIVVAFGDAVRRRAADLGLDPTDRATLMDLGQQWATKDPCGLSREVLGPERTRPDLLIVDGIRHLQVLDELQRTMPHFYLVYLSATDEVVTSRLDGQLDPRTHPSEQEIPQLAAHADVQINADAPVEALVKAVVAAIGDAELGDMSMGSG
jgi:gluconate kinase